MAELSDHPQPNTPSKAQKVGVSAEANIVSDHGNLTNVTTDQHHPEGHGAAHAENAADEILVENLGATSVDTSRALRPDGSGGATFADVAHADLSGVTTDLHHPQGHTIASHSDTTATGVELETLTDGSNADSLHVHTINHDLAYATFEQDGTHTLTVSFNCTSIADNGTGKSTITFTNAIGSTPCATANSGDPTDAIHCIVQIISTTTCRMDFSNDSHADADTTVGRMIAIGDLT